MSPPTHPPDGWPVPAPHDASFDGFVLCNGDYRVHRMPPHRVVGLEPQHTDERAWEHSHYHSPAGWTVAPNDEDDAPDLDEILADTLQDGPASWRDTYDAA